MDKIAKMVMSIAGIPQPWVLSIDPTFRRLQSKDSNIRILKRKNKEGVRTKWT